MNRQIRNFLLFSILGMFVSTGAIVAAAQSASEARLLERATSYWDAAKVRDFSTMYGMEAAAAQGTLSPAEVKKALGTSKIVGYEFSDIEMTGETAVIVVEARYSLPGLRSTFTDKRRDEWVFLEEDWYHRLRTTTPGARQ
ncbi:MAG: hypothetical protein WBG92_20520 [Thiohalocapsa sp.]